MKSRNWFWGVFFILAAIFVVASQTGSFGEISFISLLATVLLAALLIKSLVNLEFFGIFLSLALLYLIYQEPLGLQHISFWLLMLTAVLLGLGFSSLFPCHHHRPFCCREKGKQANVTAENIDDNNPYAKVSWGASSKYLHGDCFKSGHFIVSLGSLELYFDQVTLSPEGAEVFLDCNLGEMKLFLPKQWRVVENLHTSMGELKNDVRLSQPEDNAPQLTLSGTIHMGGVEIHYI